MCLTCAAKLLPGISEALRSARAALPPAAVDHHLHIQGPDVTAELRRRVALSPETFAIFNAGLFQTRTGADALEALDAAGIEQGVLLSMAYTFASHRSTVEPADVAALTRRENQFNVDAAAGSGSRLRTFIGVNPFWQGALDELNFWAGDEGVTGLKLHMGNSGFDWRSNDHIERLGMVFSIAQGMRWPVIIHARGDGDYGEGETKGFIERVLPQAGDTLVQIAHAGGGGGIDEGVLSALDLYADAIEQGAPGTRQLIFDLAVVLVRDTTDPVNASLLERFVKLARRIGLSRFVIGSDWPSLLPPLEHNELSESQIDFTDDEWRLVLANRAAYMNERHH
jgi:predicted TIM-barrel fold metal-dependent hydrolase